MSGDSHCIFMTVFTFGLFSSARGGGACAHPVTPSVAPFSRGASRGSERLTDFPLATELGTASWVVYPDLLNPDSSFPLLALVSESVTMVLWALRNTRKPQPAPITIPAELSHPQGRCCLCFSAVSSAEIPLVCEPCPNPTHTGWAMLGQHCHSSSNSKMCRRTVFSGT